MKHTLNDRQALDAAGLRDLFKIAGVLYLGVILLAGFSEGVVRSRLIVFSDPVLTLHRLSNHLVLFRWGILSDLVAFLLDVSLTVSLYLVFKKIGKEIARLATFYRLISHAMVGYNLLHLVNVLQWLTSDQARQLPAAWFEARVLFLLQAHHAGYQLGLLFFGVSAVCFGYLMIRSAATPNGLGMAMSLAGGGYLLDGLAPYFWPSQAPVIARVMVWPVVLAESGFMLWLLYRGFSSTKWSTRWVGR